MQRNIQNELNFSSAPAGEACEAGREEIGLMEGEWLTASPGSPDSSPCQRFPSTCFQFADAGTDRTTG
jgi:hypothetical protein